MLKPLLEALRSGEAGYLGGALAPDARLVVAGQSPLAGEYRGIEGFGRFLWQRRDLSDESLEVTGERLLAGPADAMLECTLRARRRHQSLEWREVWVCRLDAGRIESAFLYVFDQHAFDAFWS